MARSGAVGADLEQFIARLEGLPDAGPLIAEHLGAVGFAAMSGIGQRGPIERDKGSPGEIVELGIGVGLDRGRVFDSIGRNQRGAVLGGGRGDGEKHDQRLREPKRGEREPSRRGPHSEEQSKALRLEEPAPSLPEGMLQGAAPGRRMLESALEAPSGRLRTRGEIKNDKGNASAAFPTAPHSHSGPSVYSNRPCRPKRATQDVGIIPEVVFLFAGRITPQRAQNIGQSPRFARSANARLRLRRNARMGSDTMSNAQVAGCRQKRSQ